MLQRYDTIHFQQEQTNVDYFLLQIQFTVGTNDFRWELMTTDIKVVKNACWLVKSFKEFISKISLVGPIL